MLPVDDQGDVGACTCEALYGLLSYETKPSPHTQADVLALYSDATALDDIPGSYPPDDTGSSGLAACRAARARGLIRGYAHAFSVEALLLGLSTRGPAMIGTNWYEGMDSPDASTARIRPTGALRGGHEYVIDSLDVVANPFGGLDEHHSTVGICNSWGLSYGNQGRAQIAVTDLRWLLAHDGDAIFLELR